jgi:flagellar motility protein MotE (MotC chaperone)
MRYVRDLRLIPVVALAAAALFLLKATSIFVEGGYTLVASRAAMAQGLGQGPVAPKMLSPAVLETPAVSPRADREPDDRARSWVRDIYTIPTSDITGSVAAAPKPAEGGAPAADKNVSTTPPEPQKPAMTAGERAVLESLQQRRQELEARSREIEVRDNLLKATEKRIEQRLQEVKDSETRLTGAEKKKEEEEAGKFKSLVLMYENMKPKDAAKIFDRLNMQILVEVVNAMNPRKMSDVLGQMSPEVAEKLTVEIANRSGAVGKAATPTELPKIEGRPNRS